MLQTISNLLLLASLGATQSPWGGRSHGCDIQLKNGTSSGGVFGTVGDDTRTYFTGQTSSQMGVLFLTDIFGIDFINSQLVADSFAAQGYYTVMPDLFNGDPIPLDRPSNFSFSDWSSRHTTADVDPKVQMALDYIRTNTNIERLGIVGYCFGGRYVARWLGRNDTGINAGYTAHPASTEPDEWAAASKPLSIANAELDTTFPLEEARQAEDILRNSSIAWQFSTYSDVPHGFAIRANTSQPRQINAKSQAFAQAITWFGDYVQEDGAYGGYSSGKAYGMKSFEEEHRAVVAGW